MHPDVIFQSQCSSTFPIQTKCTDTFVCLWKLLSLPHPPHGFVCLSLDMAGLSLSPYGYFCLSIDMSCLSLSLSLPMDTFVYFWTCLVSVSLPLWILLSLSIDMSCLSLCLPANQSLSPPLWMDTCVSLSLPCSMKTSALGNIVIKSKQKSIGNKK